jgi:hypothetical protein
MIKTIGRKKKGYIIVSTCDVSHSLEVFIPVDGGVVSLPYERPFPWSTVKSKEKT